MYKLHVHFNITTYTTYAEITIDFDVIHVDSVYFEYTDCFTMITGCGRKCQTHGLVLS